MASKATEVVYISVDTEEGANSHMDLVVWESVDIRLCGDNMQILRDAIEPMLEAALKSVGIEITLETCRSSKNTTKAIYRFLAFLSRNNWVNRRLI